MITPDKKGRIQKNILYLLIIIILLNGGRMLWLAAFEQSQNGHVEHGVLDLRGWNAQNGSTLTVDGDWEFYPNQLISSNRASSDSLTPQYIKVPGNWSEALNPEHPTPYGYGSYRLTLLVDPAQNQTYVLRVTSTRSASKLFINGKLVSQSGEVAEQKEHYLPFNIPYNATFSSDEDGKIEIVIEASNFVDVRGGGLARSLKLGSERAIEKEVNLSNSLQQLVASIFLLHGLYAVMLYFSGLRQPALVWFFIFVVSFILLVMVGSEDKLLQVWLNLGYVAAFRAVLLALALMLFALCQICYPFLLRQHRKYFYVIQAINILAIASAIVLPFGALMPVNSIYGALAVGIVACVLILFLMNLKKGYAINRIYFLSLFAIGNHLLWWLYSIFSSTKVMYYPFDLIIAMTAFSVMWCRHYIAMFREKSNLTEKLQRNIDMRDEFLANTSHELRNPLHSILNIAQVILEREKALSARSVNDLSNVLAVGRRLSLMLDEMLDAMSLKDGIMRLHKTQISLHKLTVGVSDLLSYMRRSDDVVIINEVARDFPKVWGDENRTIQILYNLLHNALKFTSKGHITIKAEQQGSYALISITDTGAGMSAATLHHIFEPYEQGEGSNASKQGGFGLGLSISKKLVELQAGEIFAQSQPGAGSTFYFTMPFASTNELIEQPSDEVMSKSMMKETAAYAAFSQANSSIKQEELAAVNEAVEPNANAHPVDQARLLLVDDDEINLNVLEAILERGDFSITCVHSAEQALKLIEEREWDLVIADVMMPGMSGYELTRQIRRQHSLTELPILLLTARSRPQDLEHAFSCGANDYVRKPMDANELRSRVYALTSVKQTFRERLQMEAAWLQAQIQPHFFFNTINSVIALSEVDLVQMRQLLTAFSEYLHDKFRYNHISDMASIDEELGLVQTYLFIEQTRFGERLQVSWEVDECADLRLPPLTIQPLVENAIRHGLMKRAEGGCVSIIIKNHEQYYTVAVADNGVGMDEDMQQELLREHPSAATGVGLINTNRRLKWHYRRGISIKSELGAGTTISFHIPKSS